MSDRWEYLVQESKTLAPSEQLTLEYGIDGWQLASINEHEGTFYYTFFRKTELH